MISSLEIQLKTDLARLQRDMAEVERVVGSTMDKVGKFSRVAGLAIGGLFTVAAGAAVGFAKFAKGVIDAQDALAKMSGRTGFAVKDVVGLQHAAQLAGVEMIKVEMAIKSLSTQLYEAGGGSKEAQKTFRALGVSYKDAATGGIKDVKVAMMDVLDALSKMPDAARKNALSVKAFSRLGLDMSVMAKDGADGLRKMMEEGQRLNPVLELSARQSEAFNDNIDRLSKSSRTFGIALVNDLLPGLSQVAAIMANARMQGEGWLASMQATQLPAELKRNMDRLDWLRGEMKTAKGAELAIYNADATALERRNSEIYGRLAGVLPQEPGKPAVDPADAAKAAAAAAAKAKAEQLAGEAAKRHAAEVERANRAAKDAYVTALRSLSLTEDETEYAKVRFDIEQGRYELENKGYKQKLLILAAHKDGLKAANEEQAKLDAISAQRDRRMTEEVESMAGGDYRSEGERSAERRIALGAELMKIEREMKTPVEVLMDTYKRLNDVMAATNMTQAQYNFAVGEAQKLFYEQSQAVQETSTFAKDLGLTFTSAFESAVAGGRSLSGVLKGLAKDIAMLMIRQNLTNPFLDFFGKMMKGGGSSGMGYGTIAGAMLGGIGGLPYAKGGAFDQSGVIPFANGGIVSRPTLFPFAKGTGLMGEAGPEAIMPLKRGADGKLGVASSGGGRVEITQHITVQGGATKSELMSAMTLAKDSAKREILDSMKRGGAFA
jgi:hypothetical protein